MNTSDIQLFIRIAETGSISETAKQLNLTPAAVSYALKRLETQSGIQLFIRTTRQLRITVQGETFLYHCRQALTSLEQGLAFSQQQNESIGGQLRLSVPSDLGRNIVASWIDGMMEQYPSLSVDLNVSDTLSDFYAENVDVALRYGKPEDSSMVAFHIATLRRITCASPSYLAKFGVPESPEALSKHNCLLYRLNGKLFNRWEYVRDNHQHKIKVNSNRICNDTDLVRRWAVSGKGIAYRSQIDIHADLQHGNLVPILNDYQSPPVELYLLCPDRKQVIPAVIAFREMLRERCAEIIDTL